MFLFCAIEFRSRSNRAGLLRDVVVILARLREMRTSILDLRNVEKICLLVSLYDSVYELQNLCATSKHRVTLF